MQTTLMSGGKTIRLDAMVPSAPGRHPAILLLHGAGGNAGFWLDRLAPLVARLNIGVYAVHYFDRTDTVRADLPTLSDGVHVPLWLETIRDTLAEIRTRPNVDPERIALVGISLGAFLSLALAAQASAMKMRAVRCIVDISGGLVRPYSELATSAFPPTLIVHGDADSVVGAYHAENLRALLVRLDVPHETQILAGETHYFTPVAQGRVLAAVGMFLRRYL